jgi:hypothetical protein
MLEIKRLTVRSAICGRLQTIAYLATNGYQKAPSIDKANRAFDAKTDYKYINESNCNKLKNVQRKITKEVVYYGFFRYFEGFST